MGEAEGNRVDNLMTAARYVNALVAKLGEILEANLFCRPRWLLWGRGRHACPGRFFVVHVIKITAVMLLSSYDMRFADDVTPVGEYIGSGFMPDMKAEIQFRDRKDTSVQI